MKKLLKSCVLFVFVSAVGWLFVAFQLEKSIQVKYWDDFNDFRQEKGIFPLTQSNDTIVENWGNMLSEHPYLKWKWILANEEIATTSYFVYDSIEGKPFHQSKTIIYGTHLFFWKNFYAGEIDTFINPISSDTTVELTFVYHSRYLNPGDFFYVNIDTLYSDKPDIFFCGTQLATEAITKLPVGNISKSEADEILVKWNLD